MRGGNIMFTYSTILTVYSILHLVDNLIIVGCCWIAEEGAINFCPRFHKCQITIPFFLIWLKSNISCVLGSGERDMGPRTANSFSPSCFEVIARTMDFKHLFLPTETCLPFANKFLLQVPIFRLKQVKVQQLRWKQQELKFLLSPEDIWIMSAKPQT